MNKRYTTSIEHFSALRPFYTVPRNLKGNRRSEKQGQFVASPAGGPNTGSSPVRDKSL